MIDDIRPPDWQRPKPKSIEPPEKPAATPLHELAAAAQSEDAETLAPDTEFKAPEQVAADDTGQEPAVAAVHHSAQKQAWYCRFVPRTKRQKIIACVLAVVVAFGLGAGWTLTHHKRTVVAVAPPHQSAPKPAPIIYSTLSGLPVASEAVNQRPVTGVMIENSLDARPQSGLSQAGVVFEAVAEGGVTRYLALYQDQTPSNVGPIRSARPYYIEWDMGFDAAYAHVGGSPDGLNDIKAWGTKDMNQFYNGAYYHRITSRYAPHNVYTGISTLNKLEAAKHFTSTYTGFDRKEDDPYKPPTKPSDGSKPLTNEPVRTSAHSIDFSLSGYYYDPHYAYDAATNSYNRNEAGEPQMDANTNKQLSPKVVIAIVVPLARGKLDTSGAYYSNYNVIGSGTAYVFQDGTVQKATWQKASRTDNISFADASGQPFKLNRGQTWISAVTGTDKIHYK